MKKLVVLFFVIALGATMNAQQERSVQATFIYPMGTAGTNSADYCNKLSLNIIAGVNGGVDGFELGAVSNVNKGNVTGGQVSGVCNYTLGNSRGAIISSVANVCNGESNGAMISGVTNIVQKASSGAMISGVVNIADSNKGLQLSTVNLVKDKMNGVQIGFVNVADEAKGFQFGVVNIVHNSDSIVPVGLVNIVKDGYYAFELSTNEVFITSLSYKMGLEKFHSIFRGGLGYYKGKGVFSTGFGFGSIIPISGNHKINMEFICDNLHYESKWDYLNILSQLNLNYQYQINDVLAVKAGTGLRTYVTKQQVDGEFDIIDVPYTIFEHTGDETKVSTWVGFNAGVVISL